MPTASDRTTSSKSTQLAAGDAAGLEHYRRGEMLRQAKEQVRHGEWGALAGAEL